MTSGASDRQTVAVSEAKGRPQLTWVGKRPLRHVQSLPAQEVERFAVDEALAAAGGWGDWPVAYPHGGLLFHGDNKEVLGHLLASGFRGKVDLIYIDPPFDSGADYVRQVRVRGARGAARLDGEAYTLGEQVQYADIWGNDNYLQFMYERLSLLRSLLSESGSLFVHVDYRRGSHIRLMLDELFGPEYLQNEIIWHYRTYQGQVRSFFPRKHDTIYWYRRGDQTPFTLQYAENVEDTVAFSRWGEYLVNGTEIRGSHFPSGDSRFMAYYNRWVKDNGREPGPDDVILSLTGYVVDDTWMDIQALDPKDSEERRDYPTQKPEALLERIVRAASTPGDLVLDCFLGSGTTAIVAQRLGRRWIGADINKGAIQTATKGLMEEMTRQAERGRTQQTTLDGSQPPIPAQLSFATYRVNDYDLAIQHNEAVELACQALGVERLKTDGFFDGTLGKQLVRILPFNHPASPLDIEEVVTELRNRPTEERDIVIVALGRELACEARLADHNRPGAPNRISLIELRTDPRVAGFFAHEPAAVSVRLEQDDAGIRVVIDDFVSPSILERLRQQDGIVSPQVTDWRAMVDSVMIDPSYDGGVFEVVIADVPERKTEFVSGTYRLQEDVVGEQVAVKVTDMLGEEVLAVLDPAHVD